MSAGRSDDPSYAGANPVQRAMRRLAASAPGSRVFAPLMHRLDRPVYRLTRGRATLGSLVAGLPVALLTTTGARSGRPRTVPLLLLPTAESLAVIPSDRGRPGPPAGGGSPGTGGARRRRRGSAPSAPIRSPRWRAAVRARACGRWRQPRSGGP